MGSGTTLTDQTGHKSKALDFSKKSLAK